MRRSIISTITLISIVGSVAISSFTPARAATGTIANTVGCYAQGRLTPLAEGQLNRGMEYLRNRVNQMKNGPLKTIFQGILGKSIIPGGGIIGGTVPVSDSAVQESLSNYIATWVNKNYRDNIIAKCMTREILHTLATNTETIIKTRGRDGGATFIKNWANFQTQAQYRGENIFRAQLSTTNLCQYFSDDVKTAFGVDPNKKIAITGQNTRTDSLQPFKLKANCTLPEGFTLEKYKEDFAGNGGWDAFTRLLEPQNNLWGLSGLALDEIQKQRSLAVNSDVNQALANKGLLGISGNGKNDSCRVKGPAGDCLVYKDIKTPGTYLAEGLAAGLNAQYSWLTTGDALGSIINTLTANMTQALLNKFMNFDNPDSGGFGPITLPTESPDPEPTPTLEPTSEPEPDPFPFPGLPEPSSLLGDIETEREKYGTPMSPAELGKLLNTVAWNNRGAGWGLSRKTSGTRCPSPAGEIACDILHHQPTNLLYDVLGDSDGKAEPTWGVAPYHNDPNRPWVAPVQP